MAKATGKFGYGFFLSAGAFAWILACFCTISLAAGSPKDIGGLPPLIIPGVWAISSLLVVPLLPPLFRMSLSRVRTIPRNVRPKSNPFLVAVLTTFARAILLGALAGAILAKLLLRFMTLPVNVSLNHPVAWGAFFTALATALCVAPAIKMAVGNDRTP